MSFGFAGDAGSKLASTMSEISTTFITLGKTWFEEGFQAITDNFREIVEEVQNYVNNIKGENDTSTNERLWDVNETYNGSVMDGLMGAGDTYNYYYRNMYGSGNTTTSQVNYGSYMNMKDRGCGPMALADAYSRRTGGSVNPVSLASKMHGAGTYDVNRGTSVGGMINTGRAMGMNLTPGGVTYQSIRHASANNPITLVGSGDGFGTRKGNMHYMNVVGSDNSGRALVSNPLNGRVSRIPIGSLTNNSVLGLYGSGDTDFASKYHFPSAIGDLISTLKDFASGFVSMFTGKSEAEKTVEKNKQSIALQQLKEKLGKDDYDDVVAAAKEQWMDENPQKPGESDSAYNSRWEKDKAKYILANSQSRLEGKVESSGHDLETFRVVNDEIFGENGSWAELEDMLYSDSQAAAEAGKQWSSWQQGATSSASSVQTSGGKILASNFTPRTTIPESGNPYYNLTSTGGYNTIGELGSPRREGTNVLSNCAGYALGRFHEAIGDSSFKYFQRKYGSRNGGSFVSTGQAQGLEVDTEPLPGDVISWKQPGKWGHVAFVEEVSDDRNTIVISHSAYNGFPWKTQEITRSQNKNNLWPIWTNSGYQFLGFVHNPDIEYYTAATTTNGPAEMSDMLKKNNAWNSYKNHANVPELLRAGTASGLTPAQLATIISTGIWEDSTKLFGNKSLTNITYDKNSQQAVGLMNWVDVKDAASKYGTTVEDQMRYIYNTYFSDETTDWRSKMRHVVDKNGHNFDAEDLDAYRTATGRSGWVLNFGDKYSPYINQDIIEGSEHFYRGALVPEKIHTAQGVAENVGTAAGIYNWMIDTGYMQIKNPLDEVTATNTEIFDFQNTGGDMYKVCNPDGDVLGYVVSGTINHNALSDIKKKNKDWFAFTYHGETWYGYGFDSTTAGKVAKQRLKSGDISNQSAADQYSGISMASMVAMGKPYEETGQVEQTSTDPYAGIDVATIVANVKQTIGPSDKTSSTHTGRTANEIWANSPNPALRYLSDKTTSTIANEYLNDKWSRFWYDTKKNKWVDKGRTSGINYPFISSLSNITENGRYRRATIDEIYAQDMFGDGVFGNDTTYDFNTAPGYYRNLGIDVGVGKKYKAAYEHAIYGSGDAEMIPEIDNSKLATLNDLLGWQTDAETGSTVNQYYITRDSSTYDMIQAVLHNTFEVRSESIEALLQELLDEVRAKKSKVSTSKSGSPQDMFNNHDIPPQIKRLAIG